MTDLPDVNISSPYEKKVEEVITRDDEMEVCNPKSFVNSKKLTFGGVKKKISFIHKKEKDDSHVWDILIVPPDGEPKSYQLG